MKILSKSQAAIVFSIWRQGVDYGRRGARTGKWAYFLLGLFVGVAWTLLVMYSMGVLTKP